MENIYPVDFFPMENPDAPLVNIQFRTKIEVGSDLEAPGNWQSITFNPSTFFESLSIKDRGGAQQITLNLFDKNYAFLENIVVKSLLAARLSNKLVEEPNYAEDDTGFFQFFVSRNSAANLRIRIGYSQYTDETEFIEETSSSSETWKGRVEEKKPVIRTPWLYFQMSGANFRTEKEGLKVEIKAFSLTNSFLDKAKLVQKYAVLKGTPKDILTNIAGIMNEAAQQSSSGNDTVVFDYEDEPVAFPDAEGNTQIEVMLGSEASAPRWVEEENTFRVDTLYKSMRQLLSEICSKIRPRIYDSDGNPIEDPQDYSRAAEGINSENEDVNKTANYNYVILEEGNKITLRFYYQDPNAQQASQTYARTYVWNEEGYSIVKSLSIESKTDFATLNLPIATINADGGEMTMHVARGHDSNISLEDIDNDNVENEDDVLDYTIGNIRDVSAALESPDFNAAFVASVRQTNTFEASNEKLGSRQAAAILTRRVVAGLNNQVFRGTMEIPGDPFYLFDANLKPFSYLINIIVRRPNYLNTDGEFVEGGKAYSSGLYVISNIEHNIGSSGFSTKLEIMKWPRN